ncbi:helix-turn-helix domain-containing protein [Streptomyces sp. AV19]|uniref:helix-turn-helix domain-containing protein n=1 Tax=Streptomyces sp. AV19 TaxID=2793068 RepID=UPI0018FEA6A0|nr:helix-turn-helix transcriptional regulator [Streptomyces sp. AV19]MBH1935587.1 helix-turn-helix domain-containing protein [Streptomyces sp. AV19]MDG4534474.1 helix-turn-helix domain-containing protein [Streptomyces sp. AV19]
MPPRDTPTARQTRLGAELRKLRERAGKAARETAALLSADQAKVSNIEAGRVGVSEERIRRLAVFYMCDDVALVEALCAMAREYRGQFWWDEYRGVLAPGFLDVSELEHHAVSLTSVQSVTIPGLLQTEEYARTLFGAPHLKLSVEEIEVRVEHRMRRQQVVHAEQPPVVGAVIHEAALRMRFGGRKVARAQLERVIEVTGLPNVTVRVIPFTSEDFIEATHPVLYAGAPVSQLDTVRIGTPFGGRFLYSETDLKRFRELIVLAEHAALDPDDSRHFIHHIAREL